LGQGKTAGSCEHGNEPSRSRKAAESLVKKKINNLMERGNNEDLGIDGRILNCILQQLG
jgi:hypothetical protein